MLIDLANPEDAQPEPDPEEAARLRSLIEANQELRERGRRHDDTGESGQA